MRRVLCIVLMSAAGLWAAPARLPRVPVPTEGPQSDTTQPSTQETIPRASLLRMYRAELGKLYRDADADKLIAAHELIEQYFAKPSMAERRAIVEKLDATKIDAAALGRLARLRMHWPELAGGGVFYINERVGPYQVRYFVGLPKTYDRTKPWPLVIRLPVAAPFITQPPPDADQVVKIYTAWMKEELASHPDAAVLMPLLNLDELYGPSFAGMNSVIQPMLHAAGRANIDPARIYMVGHSMSAHATWNLALHYPTYFAAIDPLAGGASADWQRIRLINLTNVLPVVWHDAKDDVVKVDIARALMKAMKMQKVDVDYEETQGIGHAPTPEITGERYARMRSRKRELYPLTVRQESDRLETMFNRNDWLQIYQPLDPGKERRLLFRRGTGHMTVYENPFKAEATRKGNRIDITTVNVESLRLYFNDQMIKFTEPVTIVVNKKVRFEGLVKPSIDEMLKDQLFLGRGWRYYTGIVDINLAPPSTSKPATQLGPHKETIHIGPQ